MKSYNSRSKKKSGVIAYETAADSIDVLFTSGEKYTYTNLSAGRTAIESMKKLAEANNGLSTYISRKKPPYENMRKLSLKQ